MDVVLAKTLFYWAKCNTTRQAQLETWLDAAITEIANGKGASVVSTTANGVTISFNTNGLTNSQWASTVGKALQMIEAGNSRTTAVGIIR